MSASVEDGDQCPIGAKSLQELAERRALLQLEEAVKGYQSTANYCCGGSIPISIPSDAAESNSGAEGISESPLTAPPIVLRWDVPQKEGLSKKITFPLLPENSESQATSALDDLLEACTPATFGHSGKDVFDESYRKAGKMDSSQFCINFHPHDYAIIDAISQLLLPEIRNSILEGREEHRGVRAELYKLNIYSGPAGKFKAHVDTPRGATQFGSLVVCLPHPHHGGQLRISHNGHSTFFDWSNTNSTAIQWAAFYSDCEHEVLQVESGHRITFTYNLFVTENVGSVLRRYPPADPSLSPLYEGAKRIIEQPGFLKNGGILGFHCAHRYAHTREGMDKLMPFALKGIDAVLFSVFRSLGLDVKVRPMLDPKNFDWLEENLCLREIEDSDEGGDLSGRWERLNNLKIEWHKKRGEISRVGNAFHGLRLDYFAGASGEGDELESFYATAWPWSEYKDVIWLNGRERFSDEWGEVAFAHMVYGNEHEMFWRYSFAVILIEIPNVKERPGLAEAEST